MSYNKKKNHIKIFQNNRKKKPSHPDMIGSLVDENGVEFDIAMWKLKTQHGQIYFAGQISNSEENKRKREQGEFKKNDNKPKTDVDDLPF
jgi:hypothetical protein